MMSSFPNIFPVLWNLGRFKERLFQNIIIHSAGDKMALHICEDIQQAKIIISDNGKGIEDIELARKPLYTTKGNLERSGMGFTIMESFMDKVEIQSVVGIGTKIVMKKTIKKEQKQEEIEEEKNALMN